METRNAFDSVKLRSLAFWMVLSLIVIIIIMGTRGPELDGPLGDIILMILFYAIIVVWIMWKFKSFHVDYKKIIGKFPPDYKWWWILGIVALLILFSVGTFWLLYYPLSFIAPSYVNGVLNETSFYTTADTTSPLAYNFLIVLITVLVAPVVEEFLFRGVILQRLAVKWGTTAGVLISSFIFGILHGDILGAFVFGIFMSLLYINTRTLLVPIACHILNNGLAFGLSFIGILLGESETATTVAQFQSGILYALILLLVTVPIVIYFVCKNWPKKDTKLPYFA
ncbi:MULTISPECIES: CPBP family intramembrane glutamic endopeptidase [Methanobacterium]|jgi:membrane protease YdiL (CAAX protease family)|uniref:Type II CAAX endopeptidase family protein n=1 Tax=Methanobacterium veterum TaxID=408577 RepID=A0A9E4ZXV9_9EURY|nr:MULTISPECIES: type II CAAX endopeptidase family protein [Methanobacterium]MCZ3366018.1 type II CAAX endopeptidase family protein [Methanobacterium veterum]MCZ3371483.1 type II CAAX endopeptidase family protein [Methanobacterium veterum]